MTPPSAPSPDNWLVRYGTCPEPEFRMVCFPHAGGSAAYYPWLRAAVPPQGELLCVQYPGRQERHREAPVEEFTAMVGAVTDVLRAGPPLPLVLFGHSLGSLIAYETALALRDGAGPLRGLIVSGRRAPSVRPPRGGRRLSTAEIIEEMRALGGTAPALLRDPDLLELVLPALRADSRLAESYVPRAGTAVPCPLTVLTGTTDPRVSSADAAAWRAHTTGPCTVHEVTGGHFFFEQQRPHVLALIRDALDGMVQHAARA
ncbi:alpha/beta fold hydrolase [Streptomyces sp. MspMP-M5]|uniref:thioesterase II family protein n=1 Tax=unclassified Streptomyces TaxID=2593676 RepID=UPI00037F2FA2|nr:alpha/beta fold hydrolase [Streptomyces sp. MspMP-M5]